VNRTEHNAGCLKSGMLVKCGVGFELTGQVEGCGQWRGLLSLREQSGRILVDKRRENIVCKIRKEDGGSYQNVC
jgi:hypothetical protein